MGNIINIFTATRNPELYNTFEDFVDDEILQRKNPILEPAFLSLSYNNKTGGHKWSYVTRKNFVSAGFKGRAAHHHYEIIKKLLDGKEINTNKISISSGEAIDTIINLGGERFQRGLAMVAKNYDTRIFHF